MGDGVPDHIFSQNSLPVGSIGVLFRTHSQRPLTKVGVKCEGKVLPPRPLPTAWSDTYRRPRAAIEALWSIPMPGFGIVKGRRSSRRDLSVPTAALLLPRSARHFAQACRRDRPRSRMQRRARQVRQPSIHTPVAHGGSTPSSASCVPSSWGLPKCSETFGTRFACADVELQGLAAAEKLNLDGCYVWHPSASN